MTDPRWGNAVSDFLALRLVVLSDPYSHFDETRDYFRRFLKSLHNIALQIDTLKFNSVILNLANEGTILRLY